LSAVNIGRDMDDVTVDGFDTSLFDDLLKRCKRTDTYTHKYKLGNKLNKWQNTPLIHMK